MFRDTVTVVVAPISEWSGRVKLSPATGSERRDGQAVSGVHYTPGPVARAPAAGVVEGAAPGSSSPVSIMGVRYAQPHL
jgi:hypothetical protein